MGKRAVRFVKHWGSYTPSDCASFLEADAERLVSGGVAIFAPQPETPPPSDLPEDLPGRDRLIEMGLATTERLRGLTWGDVSRWKGFSISERSDIYAFIKTLNGE